MIWCVTLNPSLDVTYRVDASICSGQIFRAAPRGRAGGKGNNVARAAARLGSSVTAVGIYGGATGACIQQLLAQDRVKCLTQESTGETRRCMTLLGADGVLEVREPGPRIPYHLGRELLGKLCDQVTPNDWVTLSGSLPLDWPEDTYAEWIDQLKPRVSGILVDTSGNALRSAIEAGPTAITPNRRECQDLSHNMLQQVLAIVTWGSEGARWRSARTDTVWEVTAPPVAVRNTVGAGDSFLGGLVVSLNRGDALPDAVAYAVAVGTSSVTTEAVGDIDQFLVEQLLPSIQRVRRSGNELC